MKAKTITICAKCSDLFYATLEDKEGNQILEYDGYVPPFFPDDHYGDNEGLYVQMKIDLTTGKILNWVKPTQSDIDWIKERKIVN